MISIERYCPAKDSALLLELYKDSDYRQFFRRIPPNYSDAELLKIEELTGASFFCVRYGEEPVGFVMLSNVDAYGLSAHFGEILKKGWQDQKVGPYKLALLVTVKFLHKIFTQTTIRKICAMFLASRADIEKTLTRGGFFKEAEFKESCRFNGTFQNELQYSIMSDDFLRKYPCPF